MNMKKTTIVNMAIAGLFIVILSYIVITQPKVKAGNEILEIQKRLIELDDLEQQAKDNWHLAEENKAECIESWNEEQNKESKLAEGYRTEKQELQDRLGLLLNR